MCVCMYVCVNRVKQVSNEGGNACFVFCAARLFLLGQTDRDRQRQTDRQTERTVSPFTFTETRTLPPPSPVYSS